MMNKVLNAIAVVVSLVVVAGCGSSNEILKDYRAARLDAPLQIPDAYDGSKIVDYYAIPPVQTGLVDELAEVPKPPALSLVDSQNLVKIQTLGVDRWVLVQLVPGQVWPLISQYALTNGLGLEQEIASQGIIETDWLLKTDNDSVKEKYRIVVKQGVQRRSTEVSVLQFEAPRSESVSRINWGARPVDPSSANQTLERLAKYLADYADPTAAVSLRAQNIDTSSRLYLNVENEPTIFIKNDMARGFASAQYALDKAGLDVVDVNSSASTIYALPRVEEDDRSTVRKLFSRLAFYSRDDANGLQAVEHEFRLQEGADGWLQLTVSAKDLSKTDKKAVLKEVKRNLT